MSLGEWYGVKISSSTMRSVHHMISIPDVHLFRRELPLLQHQFYVNWIFTEGGHEIESESFDCDKLTWK